jgi:hypothetical protein
LASLGAQYLAIVAPENAALRSVPKGLTAANVAPVVAAAETADNALLRVAWPSSVLADVKLLVAADGAVIGDLRAVGPGGPPAGGTWLTQYETDAGKQQAAAQVVRADLNLPPVS